uniref:MULE transposase domain-containing protein n=1 Tax=Panagrolaimus superbus TaxID=310955 RepID=A0A914YLP6_9BILA
MAKARIIVADATFGTSPKDSKQILTVHGLIGNDKGEEWVPSLQAIMKFKSEKLYMKVVDCIKDYWENASIIPSFDRMHCDYESAEMNAFKNLNGPEKVFGCHFHYCQAFLRHVTFLGLSKHYRLVDEYMKTTWICRDDNTWTFYDLGRVKNTNIAENYHSEIQLENIQERYLEAMDEPDLKCC